MANPEDFKRVEPDSPNRCQAMTKNGQCLCQKTKDTNYCPAHGGARNEDKKELKNYRLTKYKADIQRMSESSNIKSLREEIGILRTMLEEMINESDGNLFLMVGPISTLVMNIKSTVESCHKIEGSMGQLIDKQAILQFASELIGIISTELEGEDEKINRIADQIMERIRV